MINDIPPMVFVACGPEHMMSISSFKNELYAWGNNIYGQLGLGNPLNIREVKKEKTANDIKVYKPKFVPLVMGDFTLKVEMVSLGMYHSVILSLDKYVYSCGLKKYAGIPLLDLSQTFEFADTFCPVMVLRNKKFKMVSCGEFHSLALSDNNEVYGWGNSLFGKLGENYWRGGEELMLEATMGNARRNVSDDVKLIVIPSLLYENKENKSNKQMKFVGCGPTHSACINKHGECFTWGSSISGKLGVKPEDFSRNEKEEEKADENNGKKTKNVGFIMPRQKVSFFEKKSN